MHYALTFMVFILHHCSVRSIFNQFAQIAQFQDQNRVNPLDLNRLDSLAETRGVRVVGENEVRVVGRLQLYWHSDGH